MFCRDLRTLLSSLSSFYISRQNNSRANAPLGGDHEQRHLESHPVNWRVSTYHRKQNYSIKLLVYSFRYVSESFQGPCTICMVSTKSGVVLIIRQKGNPPRKNLRRQMERPFLCFTLSYMLKRKFQGERQVLEIVKCNRNKTCRVPIYFSMESKTLLNNPELSNLINLYYCLKVKEIKKQNLQYIVAHVFIGIQKPAVVLVGKILRQQFEKYSKQFHSL